MKKIYLDSSVISFLEAHDAPDKMEITRKWWNEYLLKGKYKVYISDLTLAEIADCSEPKKKMLLSYIQKYNAFVKIFSNKKTEELARVYVEQKVIPQKYIDDAVHIALAVINRLDIIVSWNFKHMVKSKTIQEVNKINRRYGYPYIDIISPLNLIKEEGEFNYERAKNHERTS
ncbi:type II toxin-antitoxin system VapC family toxin [Thermoanaerobacter pentosaceus]|uniref:Nucleic acid-binding protein n=1 Tax=Thermoanaerobacter pentosaceus TaxID=694059 RepID=A0ABT9M2W2_9THEO|nr:type II toxin-antitoxin system VapC family toxin [Thermoanaerobacter pentosaceus]MDP9750395.1 putative nucleic acid-binding protein [Thermoanaerobacter pentosaceus]